MPFTPFARKYRPQGFEELVGQPHVATTLTRAIESRRIAQAYLFAGQRGVGKTSAARILAKCLNCAKGPTATPCHECPSCVQIAQGSSLDVIEIDGASNRGIDEIRSLREHVPYAPTHGSFRIYIIDEVHMLTTEAFNALLKTLEEPPAHVKFIFATTNPHKVLPTILSRCQRFDFRRLESRLIVESLQRIAKAEQLSVEEPALYAIARASEGSLRDAEVILEQLASFCRGAITETDVTQLLGAIEQDALIALTQALVDRDARTALVALTQQLELGRELTQLLVSLVSHVRDLMVLRTAEETPAPTRDELLTRLIDAPRDQLGRLEAQARQLSTQDWMVILQLLGSSYELIRRSPFAQAICELVLIKIATREEWASIEQLTQRLERLAQAPREALKPALSPVAGHPNDKTASAPVLRATSAPVEQSAGLLEGEPIPFEEVTARWSVFLTRLGDKKMSLAAYLSDARPLTLDRDTLTIGLPKFSLHQEVLSLEENRRLIGQLLAELFGRPLTVGYATLPDPTPPAPRPSSGAASSVASPSMAEPEPEAPPIVQDIVKLFDATIVERPPRPT